MNSINELLQYSTRFILKSPNEVILNVGDLPVRVAILEYGSKHCAKRYPRDKLILEDIDYFNITPFDDLFSKRYLIIFWHSNNKITDFEFYDIKNDFNILKRDYDYISDKIQKGEAHLISEGDTEFLGAGLTEGKTTQPNNNVLSRKRQFVLKRKYLQEIINQLGYGCRI